MPEKATNEFWKYLKPIPECFQPDAQPEVHSLKPFPPVPSGFLHHKTNGAIF